MDTSNLSQQTVFQSRKLSILTIGALSILITTQNAFAQSAWTGSTPMATPVSTPVATPVSAPVATPVATPSAGSSTDLLAIAFEDLDDNTIVSEYDALSGSEGGIPPIESPTLQETAVDNPPANPSVEITKDQIKVVTTSVGADGKKTITTEEYQLVGQDNNSCATIRFGNTTYNYVGRDFNVEDGNGKLLESGFYEYFNQGPVETASLSLSFTRNQDGLVTSVLVVAHNRRAGVDTGITERIRCWSNFDPPLADANLPMYVFSVKPDPSDWQYVEDDD